jgi:putative peptidoglycan lipid II flippase
MTTLDTQNQSSERDTGENKEKRTQHIILSTLMLMLLFGVSKGISLVQTFLIARNFGLGAELDAYVSAAKVPDVIVLLLGGGALGYAFIPIFGGFLAKGERENAWRLASHVVNTFFIAAFIGSVLAFIFAPWLMANVIASGNPPETMELSVNLMRILLIGTLIFSVSGIVMGMLQSHNHFLLPALAPIFNDLGILGGILFLVPLFGVYGMVYGMVIGAVLHLAIQIPGLIRYKAKWYPELGFNDPTVWRVIRLMLPRLAGLGVISFNMIFMNNLASRLGEGGAAAIDWGWKLMQIPETLLGSAMGIVIFPTLAALSEVQDETGKRNAMTNALRFILIATIPSSIGLLLIGRSMLKLLEGGAFDASATELVYLALSAFTLGLIVHSLLEIIARSFYADKDTYTPLWAALGGAAINFVMAATLSGVYTMENPPLSNVLYLALANSVGTGFEVVVLFYILRKRWHGLNEASLAMTSAKTLIASLVMGLVVLAIGQGFAMLGFEGRLMYTIAQLVLQIGLGGLAFVLVALLLGMNEIKEIFNLLFRRNKAQAESVQAASA